MAGLYKVSRRAMTESKVPLEDIDAALVELRAARMVFYEANVIFVRARVKRLRQRTVQIAKAIAKDVGLIAPDHPLRVLFLAEYGSERWLSEHLVTLTAASVDPHDGVTTKGSSPSDLRPSVEPLPRLKGNGNGKGKGKGNDQGKEERRAQARERTQQLVDWADNNFPNVERSFVIGAAQMLDVAGHEVSVATVTARLEATYPEVLEAAA